MMTTARTQTAFRLKDSLLEKLKWNAKRNNQSLNSYVEQTLEAVVGREVEYPKISGETLAEGRALAEKFVQYGVQLPKEYAGLDADGQAQMDKQLLRGRYEE